MKGFCAAIIPLALIAAAPLYAAGPARGWAHKEGVVDLKTNRAIVAREAADRLAIADAISRWGIAYDEGRMDVVASLFTDDASFSVLLGSAKPISSAQGKADILRTVSSAIAQQNDQRRHLIGNIVINDLTGTTASALAYAAVLVPGDPIYLGATVIYRVDLRRERDGVWRFTRFVIGMDAYSGSTPKTDRPK